MKRLGFVRREFSQRVIINGKEFILPSHFVEPKYDTDKIINESRVILMRHANSEFNIAYVKCEEKYGYGEEMLNLFLDDKYIDPPLTEFGIEQWIFASQISNQLDIGTVFVSPLRRAMQTAFHLLKSHKDFEKIKIVMCPGLRGLIFGTGDWSSDIKDLIDNEYSKYFKNLDYSLLMKNNTITNIQEIDNLFYCRNLDPELNDKIELMEKRWSF